MQFDAVSLNSTNSRRVTSGDEEDSSLVEAENVASLAVVRYPGTANLVWETATSYYGGSRAQACVSTRVVGTLEN